VNECVVVPLNSAIHFFESHYLGRWTALICQYHFNSRGIEQITMKPVFIILLSFVINSCLIADTIVTQSGTYHGRILSATKSTVNFEKSKKTITLDKSQILSYSFSASDILYLKSGETINCKIIGILKGYVVYVTPQKAFKKKEADIARIENNNGPELQIKSLPFTTNGFIPTPPQIETKSNKFNKFIYFKLPVMGLLNSSLSDWKDQYVSETGKNPDTKGYPIGGEIGYSINRFLSLGAGYEYFFHPQITLIDNSTPNKGEDFLSYSFPYAVLKINIIQKTKFNSYLNGNFGLLQAKEKIKNPQGMTTNLTGDTFAGRVKFGIAIPFSDKINGCFEIGYLTAKVKNLKFDGEEVPEYNLDFSGFNFSGGLKFIIHF
jgi:hypothetical protein